MAGRVQSQPAESQVLLFLAWCQLKRHFCGICHSWSAAGLFTSVHHAIRTEPSVPGAAARSHAEAAFADTDRASCHWIFFLGDVFSALVITETSLPKNDAGACFVRT